MEETKQTDRKSMVMEGMYRGMTGKLDEVRQSVSKELQFTSAQQVSAYEALAGTFKDGLETLLAEFRYLSQQSSAVYDYNCKERAAARDAIMEAVKSNAEQSAQAFARQLADSTKAFSEQLEKSAKETEEKFAASLEELQQSFAAQLDALREELAKKADKEEPESSAVQTAAETAEEQGTVEEAFDYDVLAEKIASILPSYSAIQFAASKARCNRSLLLVSGRKYPVRTASPRASS